MLILIQNTFRDATEVAYHNSSMKTVMNEILTQSKEFKLREHYADDERDCVIHSETN